MLSFKVIIDGVQLTISAGGCYTPVADLPVVRKGLFSFIPTTGNSVFWPTEFLFHPSGDKQSFFYNFLTYQEAKDFATLFNACLSPHGRVKIVDKTALWLEVEQVEGGGCTIEVIQKQPGLRANLEFGGIIFADKNDRRRTKPQLGVSEIKIGDKVSYRYGCMNKLQLSQALRALNSLNSLYPAEEVPAGYVICDVKDGRYKYRGSQRLLSNLCVTKYSFLKTLKRWSKLEYDPDLCERVAFEE